MYLFAKEALRRGSFVGLVVDRDLEDADSLLERSDSPSNQDAISFAISAPGKSKEKCKAAFELFKPLRMQTTRVTMRAASGAMVSLYRRSFRCELVVPISVSNADRTFSAKTLNISIRGIAIETPEELVPEEQFKIDFVLPNRFKVESNAKVVWCDKLARAALLFTGMPDSARHGLQDWIDTKILTVP